VKSVGAVLLLTFVLLSRLAGQEEEFLLSSDLRSAEAVVVGTLHHEFRFPWFDGWNERGYIAVDRVLKGSVKPGSNLSFAWERGFSQGWCRTRPDWRQAIGKPGIWLLIRDGNRYRAPSLFSGFQEMSQLQRVLEILSAGN
jgi:hypothetical protein